MDSFTFISDLVRSLSWPVIVLVAALVLRKSLARLIPNLSRLRYGKLEAEFNNDLKNADEAAQLIPHPSIDDKNQRRSRDLLNTLLEVADRSPSAAILEAWRNVELEISKLAMEVSPEKPKIPSWVIIEKLRSHERVDSDFDSLISQLRVVRNETAHSTGRLEIGERQAVTYINSSIKAIDYLSSIQQ